MTGKETQGDWVGQVAPYQRHSDTSKRAAADIVASSATLRGAVLRHLIKVGAFGATDDEIQHALGMNPSTQRPRRIELVRAGLVAAATRKRRTRTGRLATVWYARRVKP